MSNRSQQVANRKITMSAHAKAERERYAKVRHDRNGLTRCRVCGCTQADGCPSGCGWVAGEDLCTGCDKAANALSQWLNGARRANKAALWREAESIIPF